MEIVTLWNAGAIAKWAIAERYNRSVGWLDKRLEEARSIGLEVKVRQVRSGPGLIYSEDILAQITEGLRARQSHPAIAAQIGKNASFVSRAAYILRSRGVDLAPPSAPDPTSAVLPRERIFSHKVMVKYRGDVAISLPYLRCLDPEAPRA